MEQLAPDLSASFQHHHHLYIVITSKDGTTQGREPHGSCLKGCRIVFWECKLMFDSGKGFGFRFLEHWDTSQQKWNLMKATFRSIQSCLCPSAFTLHICKSVYSWTPWPVGGAEAHVRSRWVCGAASRDTVSACCHTGINAPLYHLVSPFLRTTLPSSPGYKVASTSSSVMAGNVAFQYFKAPRSVVVCMKKGATFWFKQVLKSTRTKARLCR